MLTAKANLAQAEAAYAAAKQNFGFCTVTSPSDGVIGTFPYRVGALVSASVAQPLTTVSQIGDMYVYFSMTEKQLLALTYLRQLHRKFRIRNSFMYCRQTVH